MVGEITLQQLTGNISQPIYLRGDPGYDVRTDETIHGMMSSDSTILKNTAAHLELPNPLMPSEQDLVADVYLLAHRFEDRKVRFVGWAPHHIVEDREPEAYPGSSLNRVVRPDELYTL